MPDPKEPVSAAEQLVFGSNAVRHPVAGIPLEMGSGALPPDKQAENYFRGIEQTHGKAAADAARRGKFQP